MPTGGYELLREIADNVVASNERVRRDLKRIERKIDRRARMPANGVNAFFLALAFLVVIVAVVYLLTHLA